MNDARSCSVNRPCSVCQYSITALRLSEQKEKKKLLYFAILTQKPRIHVRILIYIECGLLIGGICVCQSDFEFSLKMV